MRVLMWFVLLALFVVACNDNDKEIGRIPPQSPISRTFIPYNPPDCPNDYITLYRQPDGPSTGTFGGGVSSYFEFPAPEDPEQEKHWEKVWEGHGMVRGHIKALKDGEVEISAIMKMIWDEKGEIGLFIGDQTTPIKTFNAQNSRLIRDDGKYLNKYREIKATATVKAGEKILFKLLKFAAGPTDLRICFKPKE